MQSLPDAVTVTPLMLPTSCTQLPSPAVTDAASAICGATAEIKVKIGATSENITTFRTLIPRALNQI